MSHFSIQSRRDCGHLVNVNEPVCPFCHPRTSADEPPEFKSTALVVMALAGLMLLLLIAGFLL